MLMITGKPFHCLILCFNMKRKMISKNLLLSVLIAFIFVFGCGLFITDPPEDPQGPKNPDLFNFKDILKNNDEQFKFDNYNYLFHENFIYVDPYLNKYSKPRLLSRFGAIEPEYTGGPEKDTILVIWFLVDPTSNDPYFDVEKEIELKTRGYYILLGDSLPTDTSYTGEALFKLRYNKDFNRWIISYWRDVPTDGAAKSFFHPEF